MTIRQGLTAATILATTTLLTPATLAQTAPAAQTTVAADTLEQQFRDPPSEARPRVWWHWMNGNISKDGIAKDLAWMKRVGIGGLQNFDANLDTPQVVDKRLVYMTPEWKDAFRFAASEADRLGLELAIAASPGWSETGGPWVKPQDGMKKLVWSELTVAGGKPVRGALPALPQVTGPFQTAPLVENMPGHAAVAGVQPSASGEVAVIAVPVTEPALPLPTYALADGTALHAFTLNDAFLQSVVKVPLDSSLSGAVLVRFPRAVTVRSLRLFLPGIKLPFRGVPIKAALEVREGEGWRKVADIPLGSVPTTRSVPATTGSEFRLALADSGDKGNLDMLNAAPGAVAINFFDTGPLTSVTIADFQLFADARVDRAEEKAGYETVLDYHAIASTDASAIGAEPARVVDLTDRVRPDGTLDWTAPKGSNWRILRFGWSLTGKTNHPAPPEATGLEVDKYDAAAVRRYIETYLGMYRDAVGPDLIGKRGVQALLTDSIEVGNANWTPAMEAEFAARRGYALRPWLPVLAGTVIGSPAQSERFLFDFRTTLAELLADKHYGTIAQVAHEQGLKVYGEALEDKRPMLGDDLAMRAHADVPMAALWTYADESKLRTTLLGDMRGAASVAHVYGKPFVAAESMTAVNAPWDFAPSNLKKVIDLEFASGINRPVIHTSVHQPADDKQPGLSLAIFGQYFNRHEAWAELAKPWVDYIARTSLMLQQGRNVADVAWFIGEDSPVTALYAEKIPANLPTAHAWDFVNAAMLADALRNDGAEVVSTGGARYRAIYLGGTSQAMTLPTLERLAALVRGGATVIGEKPRATPSKADDAARFAALADALWSGDAGKGRVIATQAIDTGLQQAGIAPDFTMSGAATGDVMFVHRKLPDGEVWFLNNRRNATVAGEARFRVTGLQPEVWRAETGKAEPLSYRSESGHTVVPMSLLPEDAVFVVFRKPAVKPAVTLPSPAPVTLATLDGAWTVAFQPGRGAPASITLPKLAPLEQHADPGVKHFSGIATYSTTFTLPKAAKPGEALWLNLGQVGEIAEVTVNGKLAGHAWHKPWRVDISAAAKRGRNTLQVRVGNLWVNRLIGDAQPDAQKITFTTVPTYRPDAPLRPSGLAGPVVIEASPAP
ncbi:MAG: glycoside hydrolase [Novosphingobium sp. 28-62-57]|uniref:glycosyl hydrolase n=1 Tax=unclassified Novosphingobium TaxID=2644732 RepID=UPI000BD03C72|nr:MULTISPECIES: glycosyl hydrolase [unclassified Novosphingobium]OYW50387.1 MAG: glycoside hydrolase [Novosphingobium sp. 12-62-10]OYZ11509.1 MAG: glycoside hydrolase [Novosphingobium sp. 28-62-57]OZA36208.1 MAG: glycoside hydrolase [Novosphingobium sp. 17-62-9]HQS68572.1 glycosyl hydrolase [Novosphingobium sp.]